MTFWETEVCRRLKGLPARSVDGLNFPAAPEATAENWNRALAEFRRSNEEFRAALLQIRSDRNLIGHFRAAKNPITPPMSR